MVINVLLIQVEGNLITNLVIKDGDLFFRETVNGETLYRCKPCSDYTYDTDSYTSSMTFLFHPEYLGFYSPSRIHDFTIAVLDTVRNDKYSFTYNGLSVTMTRVDDVDFRITD